MKKLSLEFIDSVAEQSFQVEQNQDKTGLFKLFLLIRVALSLVQVGTNTSIDDYSIEFKQGLVSLAAYATFLFMIHLKCVKVSMLLNLVQLVIPVISLFTNQAWQIQANITRDKNFMYGGFKTINMATLLIIGSNLYSNCFCFIFATGIYTYQQQINSFDFYFVNYITSVAWFIFLKYLSDRDRRTTFLLKTKDEQWTHIMKDMIDDWVIMVTYSSEKDQIVVRDANQNFKKSCNIQDDKNFRTFVRSIRVQTTIDMVRDRKDSFNYLMQRDTLSQNSTTIQDLEAKINKNPNFEEVLRENLMKQENKTFLWNQKAGQVKVKRFTGVQFELAKRKYSLYSIRLIRGSDTEPFILLTIKELKHLQFTDYLSNQELIRKNLFKISNLCGKYFKISQKIFNEYQQKRSQNIFQSNLKMSKIMSELFTISNTHFVQQLYLNQIYDMKEFKFESCVTSFRINEMIDILKQNKNNQIRIIFKKIEVKFTEVQTFQRELMHLFLIFIENTIKHSKLSQPKIYIECEQTNEEILKFTVKDYGQGVEIHLLQQLLESYRVSVSREKKIQIIDPHQYTLHIRQQMKYGWVAARLLLSVLSPNNGFEVISKEEEGVSITFSIYKNIDKVVQIRTFDLIQEVDDDRMTKQIQRL